MPVQSWGHSQYWSGATASVPDTPPQTGASRGGGYTPWMTTVVIGSLCGALQMLYERLTRRQA